MGNKLEMLDFIYILILGFELSVASKIYKNFKKTGANSVEFKQRNKNLLSITAFLLVVVSAINMFYSVNLASSIYMAVGAVFLYIAYMQRIVIGDEGIFSNGKFDTWKNVKQWGFDKNRKYLNLSVMSNGKFSVRMISIRPQDAEKINEIVRKYKNKKKNKVDKKQ